LHGLTFKETVPDIRNGKVVDVVRELGGYGIAVLFHDPLADPDGVRHEYGLKLTALESVGSVNAVVLAVAHEQFKLFVAAWFANLCCCGTGCGVVVDVKGILGGEDVEEFGMRYRSLS